MLPSMTIVRGALVALMLVSASCSSSELPPCQDMAQPGDTNILSTPCPDAPGYSSACVAMPSGTQVASCEISDAPVNHFRTICVVKCP